MKKGLSIILLITIILGGIWWSEQQQTSLRDSVLRLHVIANSDSLTDQALKIEVKNRIVTTMQSEFGAARSQQEARQLALRNKAELEETARQVISDYGYSYPVQVEVGEYDFPTKTYGDFVLPQGKYEAVRVVIGEGQGQNWWCVLFPPLCLVSSSDQGLSLGSAPQAEISWKCLELLPQGARLGGLQKPAAEPSNEQ